MRTRSQRSLQGLLTLRIAGLGVCLSMLFGGIVLLVFLGAEDAVLQRQLQQALDDYQHATSSVDQRAATGAPPLHFFVGPASRLPPTMVQALRHRDDGYHEISSATYEYHVAITSPPHGAERLYAIIRLTDNEPTERLLWIAILTGAAVTSLVGFWLSRSIASRVVAPLSELVQCVEQDRPSAHLTALAPRLRRDEIGQLADALAGYIQQREITLQREARFIQDISHELRTPITIVQGAYDVLCESEQLQEAPDRERLERIGRSAARMHHTVRSLLWLAREERRTREHPVPFEQQFDAMIEEYHAILPPHIELCAAIDGTPSDAFEASFLTVALSNLIRNALDHAACHHIRVAVHETWAEVEDDGRGIDPVHLTYILERAERGEVNDNGGIGLSLVNRLCRRFAWSLQIESQVDGGTKVWIRQ